MRGENKIFVSTPIGWASRGRQSLSAELRDHLLTHSIARSGKHLQPPYVQYFSWGEVGANGQATIQYRKPKGAMWCLPPGAVIAVSFAVRVPLNNPKLSMVASKLVMRDVIAFSSSKNPIDDSVAPGQGQTADEF